MPEEPATSDELADEESFEDDQAEVDCPEDDAPLVRPPKVGVAAALLVISGALIPVIAGIALGFMTAAYGAGGLDGSVVGLILPNLLLAAFGAYLAVRLYRGDGFARWAGVGYLLLIAASSAGALAGGRVNPVSFMTVIALLTVIPLFDPGVKAWCGRGERPVAIGIAQLTGIVGAHMVLSAASLAATGGGPVVGIQVVVGVALLCLAFPLYYGIAGIWIFVCALMLVQPLLYLGQGGVPGATDVLATIGRLALGAYVVFALMYATFREQSGDEARTTPD